MGPFPVDEDGNCYLQVAICCFSRFVELWAGPDATAFQAAKLILDISGRYGPPKEIQSDNGTQYTADVIEQLCTWLSVSRRFTLPYRPQANGLVERANREVLRHLRAIVFDKRVKTDWSTHLPLVQRIMNSSYHSSIGTSPIRVLFGDVITLNRGLVVPFKQTNSNLLVNDYVKQLNESLKSIVAASQKHQEMVIAKRLPKSPIDPTTFAVGDYVLVSYPERPPDKLTPKWRGPMLVVEIKNQTYLCQDLLTQKVLPFFIDRLQPYKSDLGEEGIDSEFPTPATIAAVDRDAFVVDSIVDHKGNPKNKNSLLFRVRWAGYEPSEDTWEPYKNLKNVVALEAYISKVKSLGSLKPK
jgi:hypothetical protein